MPTTPIYAISKVEKQVLFKKYISLGFSSWSADDQIKKFVIKLKKIPDEMKSKKKTEIDINERFKEEFEKLCQDLEAKRIDIERR